MDIVRFITAEDNDALVLSFSFDEGTQFGVDGFTIQRTPKYEFPLPPDQHGAIVDWTDDEKPILIKEVKLTRENIQLRTLSETYQFDLREISDEDYQGIIKVLEKMNFDNKFFLQIEK